MSLPLTRSQWDGTYATGSMGSRVTPPGENLRDSVALFLVENGLLGPLATLGRRVSILAMPSFGYNQFFRPTRARPRLAALAMG